VPLANDDLRAENADLRARLGEAEETLRAIREGEVDAIVVSGDQGEQVYTLTGADLAYRLLVEQMQEAAATMDQEGTILFCNSHFGTLLGLDCAGLLGTRIFEHVPGDQLRLFEGLFLQGGRGGARGELALDTRDRGRIPAYVTLGSIDLGGSTMRAMFVTDLTEQRRNEEIVAEGLLAKTILEHMAEATVVCDRAGTVIQANKAAEALCACNPVLRPFGEVFTLAAVDTSCDLSGNPSGCVATEGGPRTFRTEARYERHDGRAFELLAAASVLRNEAGGVLGSVVTLTDITERKRHEDAVHQAREAARRGHSAEAELALYVTHGLLHNLGFNDATAAQARKMHRMEDEILQHLGYGFVYNGDAGAQ